MDFHLKQWREHQNQHHQEESEEQQQPPSAKVPRLLLQVDSHEPPPSESDHQPALPLFSPTHQQPSKINCFSTYPDSKPPLPPPASPTSTRFPCRAGGGSGGYFSMNQWQELELQALIFRHMVAGAAVPPELLQLVKKSLFNSPSYYLNNNSYSYYQPTLLQAAGYWGRGAMDPEPGRCRRTDGKKWRCSRDVVAGQKYCERHVHRGRNRSRKPVEFPVPTASAATTPQGVSGADLGVAVGANKSPPAFASSLQHSGLGVGGGSHGAHFSLSGPTSSSSLDIFQLNQGASETKPDSKFSFEPQNDTTGGSKYNGRVLRRFFDDWPRSDNTSEGDPSQVSPATSLSISTPVADSSLDFLKLSTGNGEDNLARRVDGSRNSNVWSGENQVATMGGPLAEALRSSTGSSPTSVLNQIPRSASETSYVAA